MTNAPCRSIILRLWVLIPPFSNEPNENSWSYAARQKLPKLRLVGIEGPIQLAVLGANKAKVQSNSEARVCSEQ